MIEVAERLKRVLRKDKLNLSDGYVRALRADINRLLSCYADLDSDSVVTIEPSADGLEIRVRARVRSLKCVESL